MEGECCEGEICETCDGVREVRDGPCDGKCARGSWAIGLEMLVCCDALGTVGG